MVSGPWPLPEYANTSSDLNQSDVSGASAEPQDQHSGQSGSICSRGEEQVEIAVLLSTNGNAREKLHGWLDANVFAVGNTVYP